ncbi:MAG: hemolysin family protein [Thermoflexaceae bacterium]|nr:hemolysin family protein [Thermoflexaceae bacterium]
MVDPSVLQLIFLIILVFLSAFFSSAETALVTVNKIRIRSMVEGGNKRAVIVSKITDDSGKMLSAILIGNNIVNLTASSLATTLTADVFGSKYIAYATGLLTLLILIFGEVTPKTMATVNAEKIALNYAPFISFLMWILTPVIWIINNLSMIVLKLLRVDPNSKGQSITENELRTIVEVSHEEGVIETEEKQMINNVFDFGDSQARDVMIPRIDMTFADINSTYQEIIDIFRSEKYTRLPVYEGTTDNVVGIINVKDLLLYDSHEDFNVRDILREPYYAYEFKKTSELMEELKKTSNNITIVLDEYGSTVGMITLEDLLEEIVGEIRDEYDEDEKDLIEKISDTEYVIAGMTKLDDFNELVGTHLESEEYDSVGGLVIELLDRLPEEGDRITLPGIELDVDKVDKNRIELIHVYLKNEDETSEISEIEKEEKEES